MLEVEENVCFANEAYYHLASQPGERVQNPYCEYLPIPILPIPILKEVVLDCLHVEITRQII